eukprot:2586158-Rhodomonas_salina.2
MPPLLSVVKNTRGVWILEAKGGCKPPLPASAPFHDSESGVLRLPTQQAAFRAPCALENSGLSCSCGRVP